MAAYRRVCDSRRLQADCQEPGISSGTLRSVIEYGLAFTFYLLTYLSAAGARDVIRAMAGRRCLLAAAAAVAAVVAWLGVAGPGRGRAAGCYSYPAGVGDPCSGRRCEFGARCRASLDGRTARCQCEERCDRYGDAADAGARCGDDGRDYADDCALRRASCTELRDIHTAFHGPCGPYESVPVPVI